MTPTGLLAASLLLWGVSTGQPAIGIALGLAIESVRFARLSTPPSARAVARAIRATTLATLAALGYAAAARNFPHAIYDWLRWLPLLLAPLPVLQRLAGGTLPFGARRLDATHAYAAAVLVAAGTGTGAGRALYLAYGAIAVWAIAARAPGTRKGVAITLAVLAAGIGQAVHTAVAALQGQVEEWSTEFFQDLFDPKTDLFRERTRIGDLGRMRLSDRIVLRVSTPAPSPGPVLLREVAFERYRNGEWFAASTKPQAVRGEAGRWVLAPGEAAHRLTIRRAAPGPEGVLPLPPGTHVLERLRVDTVERMPTGAVRARGLPRALEFDAAYGGAGQEASPSEVDLEVPEPLGATLDRVIEDERLRGSNAAATVAAIRRFFDASFAYTLELSARGPGAPPRTLGDFLLVDRRGHCEYFATATALVLRRAGVPARYVAGYSAQEWSALESAFVVRGRHAHAWTQAFVDGRWIDVDTTPARWAEVEAKEMHGLLGRLMDRVSWLVEKAWRWWFGEDRELGWGVPAAAAATLAALAFIFLRARHRRTPKPRAPMRDELARAWGALEAAVAKRGHARQPGETARAWAKRLQGEQPGEPWREKLAALARDYYRARFDPAAGPEAAGAFIAAAARWEAPS